jgi:hypothetical protein
MHREFGHRFPAQAKQKGVYLNDHRTILVEQFVGGV